jgi:hypothetical protein
MCWVLFHGLLFLLRLGEWYLTDPTDQAVILPRAAVPRVAGGVLPPPGPPSNRYIMAALAAAGRTPGDVIVSHRLEREVVLAPRPFPLVGRARLWQVTHRIDVAGPDGPYTLYVDRSALVLAP